MNFSGYFNNKKFKVTGLNNHLNNAIEVFFVLSGLTSSTFEQSKI